MGLEERDVPIVCSQGNADACNVCEVALAGPHERVVLPRAWLAYEDVLAVLYRDCGGDATVKNGDLVGVWSASPPAVVFAFDGVL